MDELNLTDSCIDLRIYVDLPLGIIPGDIGCFGIKQVMHKASITELWDYEQRREMLLAELEEMSVKIVDKIMEKMSSAERN